MDAIVHDVRGAIGIHADQMAEWIIRAARVVEPGSGKETPHWIGDAVVHLAFCAIGFRDRQTRFAGPIPEPDSLCIDDHESPGFLESISGDLKSGPDELVPAGVPVPAIKAFARDIRPVQSAGAAVPQWTVAAKITTIGKHAQSSTIDEMFFHRKALSRH